MNDYKREEIKTHILEQIEDYETRDLWQLHHWNL